MKNFKLVMILCLWIFLPALVFGETFYLKDGSVIKGQIISSDETQYRVKTNLGEINIDRQDIKNISYDSSSAGETENVQVNIPDNVNVRMSNPDRGVGAGPSMMTIGGGCLGGCTGALVGSLLVNNTENDDENDADIFLVSSIAGIVIGAVIGWQISKPDNRRASLIHSNANGDLALAMPAISVRQNDHHREIRMNVFSAEF